MLPSYSYSFDSGKKEIAFYSEEKLLASAKCKSGFADCEDFDPSRYIEVTLPDGKTVFLEADSFRERTITLLQGDSTMVDLFQNIIESKGACLDPFLNEVKRKRSEIEIWLSEATELQKQDIGLTLRAVRRDGLELEYAPREMQGRRKVVLEAVKQSGYALAYATADLQNNRVIVLEAVKQNGSALQYASPDLKSDRAIVLEAVKQNGAALKYASDAMKSDRAIVLEAVKQDGYALAYAGDAMKSDRVIVLEAVKQYGSLLQYASTALKNDRVIVLEAVRQDGSLLQYASDEMKSDRTIVLPVVKRNGIALAFASADLQNDRAIVLEAVKQYGAALKYASDNLKINRSIVLEAVKRDGAALEYAGNAMKRIGVIVLEAVKQDGCALKYASDAMKSDRPIVLEAVKQSGYALAYASDAMKSDRGVVLEAVKQSGSALRYASTEMKSDRDIVLAAVKQEGTALQDASAEMKNDREVVFEAVKQEGAALQHASAEMKNNREIVLEAVKQDISALEYASTDLKKDKDFVLIVVKRDGAALEYVSDDLKNNRETVLEAVQRKGMALNYASAEMKSDREIALAAVKQNGYALEYVSTDLQSDRDFILAAVKQNGSVIACAHSFTDDIEILARAYISNPDVTLEVLTRDKISLDDVKKIIDEMLEQALEEVNDAPSVESDLTTQIKKVALEYKNKVLANSMQKLILDWHDRGELDGLLQAISFLQEGLLLPQKGRLLALHLFTCALGLSSEALRVCKTFFRANYNAVLKNGPNAQALLILFKELTLIKDDLSQEQIGRILQGCFTHDFKKEGLKRVKLVSALAQLYPKALQTLTEFSSSFLTDHLIEKLGEAGLIAEDREGLADKFLATFLASRIPSGIFTYSSHFFRDVAMKEPLRTFIKAVLTENLTDFRHAHNSHGHLLTAEQKEIWERSTRQPLYVEVESSEPDATEAGDATRQALLDQNQLYLVDTEEWQVLFLCGSEVSGSCQRIDGDPNLNRGLMGYCLDGKVRMLAIQNKSGKTVARAVLKLLKKEGEEEPVLFVEKLYPDERYRENIEKLARAKASAMGLELYQKGTSILLESRGNVAGVEYEDGGAGVSNGIFQILAARL